MDLEVEDDPSELQAKMDQLSKLYKAEKAMSDEYGQRNKDLKEELMKKMTEIDEKTSIISELKEKDIQLNSRDQLRGLEKELAEKNAELREFEKVLIKAEEIIEAKEGYIKQLLNK